MKNIIITIAAFLLFASAAFGQGSIAGRVVNEKAEHVRGVTVTAFDADGKVAATATTDENGEFTFDALDAGKYKISVGSPSGYQDGVQNNVMVIDDADTTVTFILKKKITPLPTPAPAASIVRTDFGGMWRLDQQKSELGQLAPWFTREIQVQQKSDAITFARTAPSFDGSNQTSLEALPFDGKVVESPGGGTSKRKASIKWMPDGKGFVITYTLYLDFNGQTTVINGTETYTLSADGRFLTMVANSTSSIGDFATKAVYGKYLLP